jgi:hypothetical protein
LEHTKVKDDVFVEERYGSELGRRYAITQFSYSEQFNGIFTRQQFVLRKYAGSPGSNDGEFVYNIW